MATCLAIIIKTINKIREKPTPPKKGGKLTNHNVTLKTK